MTWDGPGASPDGLVVPGLPRSGNLGARGEGRVQKSTAPETRAGPKEAFLHFAKKRTPLVKELSGFGSGLR